MVSIIIPVYNVEKYLVECIESVINQSFSDLEIILIDDGSTDESGNICDKYAQKDKRIKVIHKENGGLSSARNAGIEIATGELYTFIDSDDYIAKNMIEQLVYISKTTDSDISVCAHTKEENELDDDINTSIEVFTKAETIKHMLREKKILTSACGKLYKKKLFNKIRYPNGLIYEDLGTTYKLVELSNKIAFANTKKYYYRTNSDSITQAKFSNKQLDYFVIAQELQEFIKERYPQYLRYAINHSIRISIAFIRKISICGFNDKDTIDFLVKKIRKNIFGYLFSGYSIFSKMYGLLICINIQAALKLFQLRKK